jgi:hypothetical protein
MTNDNKENTLVIPLLGTLTPYANSPGMLCSNGIIILGLTPDPRCFIFEDYEDDGQKDDYHIAIANFLSSASEALKKSQGDIFKYYETMSDIYEEDDYDDYPKIESAEAIWDYVHIGKEIYVSRRARKDNKIYLSIESECDWEPEHGLQIVFKEGLFVNKVGPYDGHLTNADSYANPALEDVVYYGL